MMPGIVWAQSITPKGLYSLDGYEIIGFANVEVSYKMTWIQDPNNSMETNYEDLHILQIAPGVSKYYSQTLFLYTEESDKKIKQGAKTVPSNPHKGSYGFEIYKNYPSKDYLSVTELGYFPNTKYRYEELMPAFEWTITDDIATILSYQCQKATTTFRGREYEVWFTRQIPIKNGPWKFGGLPGLILKASDSQRHYLFECVKIENHRKGRPIKFYDIGFTQTSRPELNRLFVKMHEDIAAYWESIGVIYMTVRSDGMPQRLRNSPNAIPYNPMELE
jgi:GLPGLI family protein